MAKSTNGDFEKMFRSLCGKYSPYAVWQDYITMTACAISNAVDKRFWDDREGMFNKTRGRYTDEEYRTITEMYGTMVMDMETKPECDYLGELYMGLELGNKNTGQFFTPYSVCAAMSRMAIDKEQVNAEIEKRGWISLNDPACGAGATLVSAAYTLRDYGINYQQNALLVGQDIDFTVGMMCYIQLSLLGCAGYVYMANTLTNPLTGHVLFGDAQSPNMWYTPMYFSDVWHTRRVLERYRLAFKAVEGAVDAGAKSAEEPKLPKKDEAKPEKPAKKEAPKPTAVQPPVAAPTAQARFEQMTLF